MCPGAEVYAAREKNGVYIPKERYIQEESEKKVILPVFPFFIASIIAIITDSSTCSSRTNIFVVLL